MTHCFCVSVYAVLLAAVSSAFAAFSPIATLPDILPTRFAVGPDGTFYAVHREDKDEFTIYKIDGQSFAVSEIPLPEFDFELNLMFDLDVATDGRVLIGIEDRRARRSDETGYPLLYAFPPRDDWLLYLPGGSADNRWFFSYGQDAWVNVGAE